jgi:hypothetical protein
MLRIGRSRPRSRMGMTVWAGCMPPASSAPHLARPIPAHSLGFPRLRSGQAVRAWTTGCSGSRSRRSEQLPRLGVSHAERARYRQPRDLPVADPPTPPSSSTNTWATRASSLGDSTSSRPRRRHTAARSYPTTTQTLSASGPPANCHRAKPCASPHPSSEGWKRA